MFFLQQPSCYLLSSVTSQELLLYLLSWISKGQVSPPGFVHKWPRSSPHSHKVACGTQNTNVIVFQCPQFTGLIKKHLRPAFILSLYHFNLTFTWLKQKSLIIGWQSDFVVRRSPSLYVIIWTEVSLVASQEPPSCQIPVFRYPSLLFGEGSFKEQYCTFNLKDTKINNKKVEICKIMMHLQCW